ncbi:prolyl endopeptidase [Reticulibacter mediterranei]|uniref:prolyl oligopeptidase n=1 Tax=Reticulibacter mediterranei TaxID=2778369 RepID=A0A8J3N277_9CHLR|nr:prolyl oligopeptidase family serine peptidase [Reticulibacter mediterranei]GHO93233.1 prolyl endopeptidase [Reticulibacter mediterranei]
MNIPPARRDETQDNYHDTIVVDPYRWLEDAASEETHTWSEAQNALARAYLDALPARERIQARYTELMNYPKYGVPRKKGDRYFFSKNSGLQNQAVLYMQQPLGAESKLVLDPNTLSSDGTVALTNQVFSRDGRLLAYGASSSGSDWQELRIRDVDSGTDYEDVIRWCKFTGIAWRHDDTGYSFYYSRFPQPGTVPPEDQTNFNKVYWHKVGTTQEEDVLIYECPDQKELAFDPFITDDEQYLLLHVWYGTDPKNRVYYREAASDAPFVRLLDEADASYNFIGNDGPLFYFQTDLEAPRGRIIAIDIRQPERANWRELVPEQEDVIAFALMVSSQFVIAFMHHAHHVLHIYGTDGGFVRDIALPTLGSIAGISGKQTDTELFFSFTSFLYPPSVYRYDFTDQTLLLLYGTEVKFDPSNYTTQQVFYSSKDGTRVPMFLIHKKDLALDGNNPVLLYGYGGFNVSLTPSYSTNINLWVEHGGVYAVANLRGGNEYGEEWHQAGMLEKKQNVFDDFIAAAEWLIANKYTSSSRLAITGGSNGGLLVAACMLQRPELYGAVVCRVPVIDMLRYHRFTVGRYWIPEYGNAEQSEEHFRFLYAYSPLHNIKPGTVYPPTLIMTADTDDRVVPAHAKKFTATLQPANGGNNPILLRLEMKAGHGLGKPTAKIIEEESDVLAFLFDRFHMQA